MARTLGALLFHDFEVLDLFGPLEMFGNMPGQVQVVTVAERAGPVRSAQGPRVQADHGLPDCPRLDLLLIPGGIGTRTAVENARLTSWLAERAAEVEVMMTVCTGTSLLAQAGLLDGRRATTNKMFFSWPETTWPAVHWVREARWVEDGKFWTSSGVSAGIDMALAVVARLADQQTADFLATATEYEWHRDASWDPFARVHGLV